MRVSAAAGTLFFEFSEKMLDTRQKGRYTTYVGFLRLE